MFKVREGNGELLMEFIIRRSDVKSTIEWLETWMFSRWSYKMFRLIIFLNTLRNRLQLSLPTLSESKRINYLPSSLNASENLGLFDDFRGTKG